MVFAKLCRRRAALRGRSMAWRWRLRWAQPSDGGLAANRSACHCGAVLTRRSVTCASASAATRASWLQLARLLAVQSHVSMW